MELNLLQAKVKWNLEVFNVLLHVPTQRILPRLIEFNILKVTLAVLIVENVALPLRVVLQNSKLVQVEVYISHSGIAIDEL